ncbi:hypothetical protein Krac_3999 [Ktedonobacter racemifer DSM 44963]|uniref:Uncharacterized protein n=1 Tax=Ktedonobacter racemifer DSM 44963 TaxID=485913 RepID=D6TXN5_KTERA|nr:hypothetical protein Krac_3999 [Ktedonobacter racemifer DSM 44963]
MFYSHPPTNTTRGLSLPAENTHDHPLLKTVRHALHHYHQHLGYDNQYHLWFCLHTQPVYKQTIIKFFINVGQAIYG